MADDGFRPGFRITEHQPDAPRDTRDEIEFHLAMRERELLAQGLSPAEAKRAALAAFGDAAAVRTQLLRIAEESARRHQLGWFAETVGQDMQYALRGLRRNPLFAAIAVAILALGIGANAVIFSLTEAALLRAPAVLDPDRLAAVYTTSRRGQPRAASSYLDYLDYRDRSTRFAGMAAYSPQTLTLARDAGAELVTAELVTGNFFSILGLRAVSGRLLQPADDAAGADHGVAVVSHSYWRSRFGGDAGAVGRVIRLNGTPYEVVGVAPRGFDGLVLGQVPDVWLPLQGLPQLFPTTYDAASFENRGMRWISGLVARLAEGASIEQARSEMHRISDQLFLEDSVSRGPRRVTVDPLPRRILLGGELVGPFLGVLQGVAGLTLLLACANLANLLLARATSRRGELAVRLALGVDRARLMRQLLTEHLVLSLLGGGAALVLAALTLRAIAGMELPFGIELGSVGAALNARVTGFTLGLALVTGILFGVVPAAGASGGDVAAVLREARAGETRRSLRLRATLIAVQLALALVLLVGAGLFVRTLRNRLAVDLGFPVDGLAMITVDPSMNRYTAARSDALISELVSRAAALPGVRAASAGAIVPVQGIGMGTMVSVDGYQRGTDEEMRVEFNVVAPGFLRALGLPLIAGREITDADVTAGAGVTIIDETMAERWFRGRDPLGGVVRFNTPSGIRPFTIIGVARRSAWGGIEVGTDPFAFLPASQLGFSRATTVIARTDGNEKQLLPALRSVLADIDGDVAPISPRTMGQEVRVRLAPQRAAAWLLSAFGFLALVLASVGIYGVMSFVVAQRRRDIGVRMVLGANRRHVVRLIARAMVVPVVAGLAAGLTGARALTGLLDRFVFGVAPSDTATFLSAAGVLTVTAVAATLIPAVRAGRVPPSDVMRQE